VLSPSDIERLTGLEQEILRLDQDVLYAANAGNPHTSECLEAMHRELSDVQSLALEISDLMTISIKMQLPADEATVNQTLATQIEKSREQAERSQQRVNTTAGYCSDDILASGKAQEASQILSAFDGVMHSLENKLGGTLP
jgi:hypothetical protein